MTITVVVLLIFPWDAIATLNPLRLWFMLGYTILATYVLRSTWKRERVMVEPGTGARSLRGRLNARAGAWSRPVNARWLVALVAATALAGTAHAWMRADGFTRYGMTAIGVTACVALFLAWWTET